MKGCIFTRSGKVQNQVFNHLELPLLSFTSLASRALYVYLAH